MRDVLFGRLVLPTAVLEGFYRSVEDGDLSKAYQLLTARARNIIEKPQNLELISEVLRKQGGIKLFRVIKEEPLGQTFIMHFEITFGKGAVKTDEKSMKQEDGQWRIDL